MNFKISHARETGGKAGKGKNRTSTVRVIEDQGEVFRILKQFRYKIDDPNGLLVATDKAMAHLDKLKGSK